MRTIISLLAAVLTVLSVPAFTRAQSDLPGDVWCDSVHNVCDPVWMLHYFFQGCQPPPPIPCPQGGPFCNLCLLNVDGDSIIDFADFWYLTAFTFTGGDPPLLCGSAPYQPADPGQRDTVKIDMVYASAGSSFQLDIHISQDESVAISLPLAFADTLKVNCDSVKVILPDTEHFQSYCDFECQGTKGLFFYTSGSQQPLPPGTGALFRVFGTVNPGADTGMVWLDTTTQATDRRLSFTWFDSGVVGANRARRLLPEFIRGGVQIVPCVAKPGDANASGEYSLADAISIVNYVFNKDGCVVKPMCWLSDLLCRGDWDGGGTVTLGDVIRAVNFIFNKPGGPWNALPVGGCCLP